MVIDEENLILKYVAGSLVREMLASGTAAKSLWPNGIDPAVYENFPDSQGIDSQWTDNFIYYLDDYYTQTRGQQSK